MRGAAVIVGEGWDVMVLVAEMVIVGVSGNAVGAG